MNIKKYKDFQKSHPQQLELFSFPNLFEKKKDIYSGTVDLYDIVPKYFHGDIEKVRTKDGLLKSLERNFVYKKQEMILRIAPAQIITKGGEKAFYPSQREEIIEDVLRKFATDSKKNEFLDDKLSVRFTLYELWKELKKIKHSYKYNEIKESLEILSGTKLEIKDKNNKVTFSSSMFESFGMINENNIFKEEENEEYSKKIIYFVRFNSLVSDSIKNKTWRLINYQDCMSYKKVISRWLHKRISHMFLVGDVYIPYNILLSTIIRDSGMTLYKTISENIRQIETCIEEMVKIGSINKYEVEKIYFEDKMNKIKDVKFLLYISDSFFKDIQLSYLVTKNKEYIKSLNNNNQISIKNDLDGRENKIKEIVEEILSLFNKNNISINGEEVKKIFSYLDLEEKEKYIDNTEASLEYILKQEKNNKEVKSIAILTKAIKEGWKKNNDKKENSTKKTLESINKDIEGFLNSFKTKKEKDIFSLFLFHFGKTEFFGWFLNIKLDIIENEYIFSSENGFIIEYFEINFLHKIEKICKNYDPNIKKIKIVKLPK